MLQGNGNIKKVELESRKKAHEQFSKIKLEDGRVFVFLPGKPRDGLDGTLLGKGKFGRVKQVVLQKPDVTGNGVTNTRMAVKIIDKKKLDGEEGENNLSELKHEVDIMKHLGRNAEIVQTDDKIYIFMDIIPGIDLKDYFIKLNVESNKESTSEFRRMEIFKEKLKIFEKLLDAATRMHQRHVLHGDLHFGNVRYDPATGQVEIFDFGFSKITDKNLQASVPDRTTFHLHMAPEAMFGKTLTAKGDLYSIAQSFWDEIMEGEYTIPLHCEKEFNDFLILCRMMMRGPLAEFPKDEDINHGQDLRINVNEVKQGIDKNSPKNQIKDGKPISNDDIPGLNDIRDRLDVRHRIIADQEYLRKFGFKPNERLTESARLQQEARLLKNRKELDKLKKVGVKPPKYGAESSHERRKSVHQAITTDYKKIKGALKKTPPQSPHASPEHSPPSTPKKDESDVTPGEQEKNKYK